MNHLVKAICYGFLCLSTLIASANLHADTAITKTGDITDKRISEASGLAASRVQDNLFWIINDSGHDSSLFAVNNQGKIKGSVEIEGIKNKDWEDLAAFEYKGKHYLLIADIGDNKGKRKHVTLYVCLLYTSDAADEP